MITAVMLHLLLLMMSCWMLNQSLLNLLPSDKNVRQLTTRTLSIAPCSMHAAECFRTTGVMLASAGTDY